VTVSHTESIIYPWTRAFRRNHHPIDYGIHLYVFGDPGRNPQSRHTGVIQKGIPKGLSGIGLFRCGLTGCHQSCAYDLSFFLYHSYYTQLIGGACLFAVAQKNGSWFDRRN